jgi:DNA-binding NarL/FixJ family response regulator
MSAFATIERAACGGREPSHPLPARMQIVAIDSRPLVRLGLARMARAVLACEARVASDLSMVERALSGHGRSERVLILGLRSGDEPSDLVARARRLANAVICTLDSEDPRLLSEATQAGADGLLLLELTDGQALARAISAVRAGESVTPLELLGSCGRLHQDAPALTARCLQVLRLLAEGLHDDEIAQRLGVSTSAVRKHIATAQFRLRAATRTQAVSVAIRRGCLR